jgi:hypothetical protein
VCGLSMALGHAGRDRLTPAAAGRGCDLSMAPGSRWSRSPCPCSSRSPHQLLGAKTDRPPRAPAARWHPAPGGLLGPARCGYGLSMARRPCPGPRAQASRDRQTGRQTAHARAIQPAGKPGGQRSRNARATACVRVRKRPRPPLVPGDAAVSDGIGEVAALLRTTITTSRFTAEGRIGGGGHGSADRAMDRQEAEQPTMYSVTRMSFPLPMQAPCSHHADASVLHWLPSAMLCSHTASVHRQSCELGALPAATLPYRNYHRERDRCGRPSRWWAQLAS